MRCFAVALCLNLWLSLIALAAAPPQAALAAPAQQGAPPVLENPGFECGLGYHNQDGINGMVPDGWTGIVLPNSDPNANPKMCSTQMLFGGSCSHETGYEKLEGYDSYVMLGGWNGVGQDFDSPPFDVALYQPVKVDAGTDYSVSAWLTSLCGGSASPNDCPTDSYISKLVGLEPTGGTDPLAPGVEWMEDRRPHTTAKWVDVSVAARAQGVTLTVIVRVNSPFHHRGNLAFADAVKLVRAPHAALDSLPAQTNSRTLGLSWSGNLGPDLREIKDQNGQTYNYHLYYDLQYRAGAAGNWQAWLTGSSATGTTFLAATPEQDMTYYFRVRARAEQPDGEKGGYPNHRFISVWAVSGPVRFGPNLPDLAPPIYLPALLR